MELVFRHGEEIEQREAGVSILQKYWKGFAPRDVDEWSERIANSRGYVVAAYVGNVIAAVLEAMRLDVGGDRDAEERLSVQSQIALLDEVAIALKDDRL